MDTASVQEAAAAAFRGETVIDVRTALEFGTGHIPHAVLMTLDTVPQRLAEIPRRHPVYVMCESGARAFQVCGYLDQHGYRSIHVRGGMAAWRAAGLPMRTATLAGASA